MTEKHNGDYYVLSKPVTINREDGTTLFFKVCSVSDRIEFRNLFRAFRKVRLVESLRLRGTTPEQMKQELEQFDARPLFDGHAVEWLNELEGQAQAILLSMRHDKSDAEMVDLDRLHLSNAECLTVAAGVMHVPLTPADPEGRGPLAGSGNTTNGTGAASAPPSAISST